MHQQETVVSMNNLHVEPKDHGHSRLPPEIWLEIVQMLPRITIRDLTMTSRSFRQIVQPLLFHCLTFRPFVVVYNIFLPVHHPFDHGPRMMLNRDAAERYNTRLERAISNSWITSVTRSVEVYPFYASRDNPCCGEMEDNNAGLLMRIIDSLPLFSNLSKLSVQGCVWSDHFWHGLALLPRLRSLNLSIQECSIAVSSSVLPAVLYIKTLQIRTRYLVQDPPEQWLSRIRSDTATIDVSGCRADGLRILCRSQTLSSHLRSLETVVSSPSELETFLALKPPIKTLTLYPSFPGSEIEEYGGTYTPPPLLESYRGPVELLRQFLTGPHSPIKLIHISLHQNLPDHIFSAQALELVRQLGESAMAKRLETLEMHCDYLTSDLLYTIFIQFIHLKDFTITATCSDRRFAAPPNTCNFMVSIWGSWFIINCGITENICH